MASQIHEVGVDSKLLQEEKQTNVKANHACDPSRENIRSLRTNPICSS
jgi:hypothetical protein